MSADEKVEEFRFIFARGTVRSARRCRADARKRPCRRAAPRAGSSPAGRRTGRPTSPGSRLTSWNRTRYRESSRSSQTLRVPESPSRTFRRASTICLVRSRHLACSGGRRTNVQGAKDHKELGQIGHREAQQSTLCRQADQKRARSGFRPLRRQGVALPLPSGHLPSDCIECRHGGAKVRL